MDSDEDGELKLWSRLSSTKSIDQLWRALKVKTRWETAWCFSDTCNSCSSYLLREYWLLRQGNCWELSLGLQVTLFWPVDKIWLRMTPIGLRRLLKISLADRLCIYWIHSFWWTIVHICRRQRFFAAISPLNGRNSSSFLGLSCLWYWTMSFQRYLGLAV